MMGKRDWGTVSYMVCPWVICAVGLCKRSVALARMPTMLTILSTATASPLCMVYIFGCIVFKLCGVKYGFGSAKSLKRRFLYRTRSDALKEVME